MSDDAITRRKPYEYPMRLEDLEDEFDADLYIYERDPSRPPALIDRIGDWLDRRKARREERRR